jgi:hypothetical protein
MSNEEAVEEVVTDAVEEAVTKALDPNTFDVVAYLGGQPIAEKTVEIFVNTQKASELADLVSSRAELLGARRIAERNGLAKTDLSIADEDEDTEYDDRINELYAELKASALIFDLKSVSPTLQKAISKKYIATQPKTETGRAAHDENHNADILSRAIVGIRTGDGKVNDTTPWTKERLKESTEAMYVEQSAKLLSALYEVVNIGSVFDEALTADFS